VDAIIAGDEDLLVLGSYKGTPITTPREFWDRNVAAAVSPGEALFSSV